MTSLFPLLFVLYLPLHSSYVFEIGDLQLKCISTIKGCDFGLIQLEEHDQL